jgi:hypothetical protein
MEDQGWEDQDGKLGWEDQDESLRWEDQGGPGWETSVERLVREERV